MNANKVKMGVNFHAVAGHGVVATEIWAIQEKARNGQRGAAGRRTIGYRWAYFNVDAAIDITQPTARGEVEHLIDAKRAAARALEADLNGSV